MNNLVKKDVGNFMVPFLPPPLPPMEYKTGLWTLIENWLANCKRQQIARAKELEAQISESNTRAFISQQEMLMAHLTFGQRLQTELESLRNRTAMEQELLTKVRLENQIALMDFKKMELQMEQIRKELEGGLTGR